MMDGNVFEGREDVEYIPKHPKISQALLEQTSPLRVQDASVYWPKKKVENYKIKVKRGNITFSTS